MILLLSLGTIFNVVWLIALKKRLNIHPLMSIPFAVLHTAFGVMAVKLFAVIETMDFDNIENMSLFGGIFFMPLLYFAVARLTKRKVADIFDVGTICMLFTLMCARFNCLFTGCCKGIVLFGNTNLLFPSRECEIIFYAVLLIWLGIKVKKGSNQGEIYPIYMMSYGVFRFIIEFLRQSSSGSILHIAHLWALVSFALGVSIYVEIKQKKSKQNKRSKC